MIFSTVTGKLVLAKIAAYAIKGDDNPAMEPKAIGSASGVANLEDRDDDKVEKKLTVLETHGYTLGRAIGAGSYGTVKVAKSDRHDCRVAVKIVSKFHAPGEYLKKFLPREIEVVKGLKHPNLIRFLQAIETTHRVYIIMEYAQNGNLLDIIRRDTYIDEFRSRRWFRQLIEAIDYCHQRGVVHRDIKCENLLMDNDFNVKLSDFGFARGHMKPENGVVPLSETFCGSYAYASPEILRGIPYQPQLSDIWSMGVVLYAMVYGRLPFDDSNYAQLLKQVQSKVTFPKRPKVSQSCRSLIMRILVPQKTRLQMSDIRSDVWLAASLVAAQTSTTDSLIKIAHSPSTIKETKVVNQDDVLSCPEIMFRQDILNGHHKRSNMQRADIETQIYKANEEF